jgi:hypothetical protein
MLRVNIYFLVWLSFFTACTSTDRKIVLKKGSADERETIQYEGSKKHGNYINVTKKINGVPTHYSLKVSDSGNVLHVLKYHNERDQKNESDLDYYRDMQILVTDSSRSNGPDFFGHQINGYYDDTFLVNNVLFDRNTKIMLLPLLEEEKRLLKEIDSLTKTRHIKYISFDNSKVLGWFKYIF